MAFTQMEFNPPAGLADKSTYLTRPATEDVARENVQRVSNQLRDFINDTLLAQLQSSEPNESGAHNIGSANIMGVDGNTLYAQLTSLKTQVDSVILPLQTLVATLESSETGESGAEYVGSAEISGLTGATTVRAQIAMLRQQLVDLSLDASGLVDDSVLTRHILNGAVTTDKIGNLAVTTAKIADGAVDTEQMADGAITGDKIADAVISGQHIAENAIGTTHIADSAVTEAKLQYKYPRVATDSTTDLDNMTAPGMWRIGTNTGLPNSSSGYGNMLVLREPGSNTIAQMLFDYNSNYLYWRSGNPAVVGGGGTWNPWRKIYHSGSTDIPADTVDGYHASSFLNKSLIGDQLEIGRFTHASSGYTYPYIKFVSKSPTGTAYTAYLYSDTNGVLRISNTLPTAPTGTVVGTQS